MPRTKLRAVSRKRLPDLKNYLDEINQKVEVADYVADDPVSFMHAFDEKKDQEIAGFLAATMAWGRRDIVINKVDDFLKRIDYQPHGFISSANLEAEFERFRGFKHRTFKPVDMLWLSKGIQQIYHHYDDLEEFFRMVLFKANNQPRYIFHHFHDAFFELIPEAPLRTRKHVANSANNSSCKRLWLYLKWAVRKNSPIDTGIYTFISEKDLVIPLDTHVARQSRRIGLLTRTYNDWKAVEELQTRLEFMNPQDPAKYDFALFGLGALGHELPTSFNLNKVE
jgi:uncharacterized protein (TIGR02757 family)